MESSRINPDTHLSWCAICFVPPEYHHAKDHPHLPIPKVEYHAVLASTVCSIAAQKAAGERETVITMDTEPAESNMNANSIITNTLSFDSQQQNPLPPPPSSTPTGRHDPPETDLSDLVAKLLAHHNRSEHQDDDQFVLIEMPQPPAAYLSSAKTPDPEPDTKDHDQDWVLLEAWQSDEHANKVEQPGRPQDQE